MNLENIMLRKEASHKIPHIIGFYSYDMFIIRKSIETEIDCGCLQPGTSEMILKDTGFL